MSRGSASRKGLLRWSRRVSSQFLTIKSASYAPCNRPCPYTNLYKFTRATEPDRYGKVLVSTPGRPHVELIWEFFEWRLTRWRAPASRSKSAQRGTRSKLKNTIAVRCVVRDVEWV